MVMPKSIAGWCTVLFFLVTGVNMFLTFPIFTPLIGIFALGAAVFTFLGK